MEQEERKNTKIPAQSLQMRMLPERGFTRTIIVGFGWLFYPVEKLKQSRISGIKL
jgi:hypothetical protein